MYEFITYLFRIVADQGLFCVPTQVGKRQEVHVSSVSSTGAYLEWKSEKYVSFMFGRRSASERCKDARMDGKSEPVHIERTRPIPVTLSTR